MMLGGWVEAEDASQWHVLGGNEGSMRREPTNPFLAHHGAFITSSSATCRTCGVLSGCSRFINGDVRVPL